MGYRGIERVEWVKGEILVEKWEIDRNLVGRRCVEYK